MRLTRRLVVAGGAVGGAAAAVGLIRIVVDGREEAVTPAEARHRGAALRSLSAAEAATLERLGEVLLPGAGEAGIVHFVDHHLSIPPAGSLLTVRYLDVPPPYADFYRAGLAALDAHATKLRGRGFAALPPGEAHELVAAIAAAPPRGWQGPPSPLLYFAVRSDAVDVVYGTQAGFERLGIPYMAHLEPETPW
ncbi:MAG: gluconate 2-dehydrogenase subunit 3 family protein [Allosphingosinicella sp.]